MIFRPDGAKRHGAKVGCGGTEMSRPVFLFPGQGSQEPGMGKALAETFPEAAALLELSGEILGGNFLDTLFFGDEEELSDTRIAQPAVFVVSLAAAAALRSLGVDPCGVAGHSLGEHSALVAAGVLSFEDGLSVVQERARLMADCAAGTKGGMVAILGMDYAELKSLVDETARECPVEIANINSPEQIVVTGNEECVEKFADVARERGARKAVRLRVSGAFHSTLMSPVSEGLARVFEQYVFSAPCIPLVSNVTGDFVSEPTEIERLLVEHVRRPVRWEASMRRFLESGQGLFVEVGPGRVLKGLMRQIDPSVRVLSAGQPEAVRKTADELMKSGRRDGALAQR
jgi:[acyl-carrier-protein] S-malonyltransferase